MGNRVHPRDIIASSPGGSVSKLSPTQKDQDSEWGGAQCYGTKQYTDEQQCYKASVCVCVFEAALLPVERFLSALRGKKGNVPAALCRGAQSFTI